MQVNEQNYVEEAERVIIKLTKLKDTRNRPVSLVTTSKLRNLLALTSDIYNEVMGQNEDTLKEEICSRIEYLRVRFLYEAGREPAVRRLVEEAKLLEVLKGIHGSKKNFILFSRYMEALVAFRKYYDENDD